MRYNRQGFPFYDVFDELTDWAASNQADSLETYLRYRRLRRDARLTPCPDYASTSVTSGGHARRPDLDSYAVINANTDTARRIIAEMSAQGTVDARATVLPVDLGYLPQWRQSDYMHFWSLIISGPDLGMRKGNQAAGRYEHRLAKKLAKKKVDLPRMNDSSLDAKQRAEEYFKFIDAFVNAIDDSSYGGTPARSVIGLIDPETSLGCQSEKLLAKMLGLPVKRVSPVRLLDTYSEAIQDHKLVYDLDELVRFGGVVVEAARGSILISRAVDV